jgi:hypothetical protein
MRIFLIVIMTVVAAATIIMVVLNRGSERIVTTFLLGLVATLGALMALFFYGADEPIHQAFSSVVMIDTASRLPFERTGFTNIPMTTLIGIRDEIKKHAELRSEVDSNGAMLYHHALQRAIISWLELKYPNNWEADLFPLDFGESHGYAFVGKPGPSRVYRPTELCHTLAGNSFAELVGPFGPIMGLALPPKTSVKIAAPHQDSQLGQVGLITVANRFCTFTIQTRYALGGHLKTGHTWTLQNRPTERNQNNSIYTPPDVT